MQSIYHSFLETSREFASRKAATYYKDDSWQTLSWQDLKDLGQKASSALIGEGVLSGDKVVILSQTRLEWVVADLAIIGAGAVTVPIYQSNLEEEILFIIQNSGASYVFAEDEKQLKKLRQIRDRIPQVKRIVCFDSNATLETQEIHWESFLEQENSTGDSIEDRIQTLSPESLLTIVYTSGTTGTPKGVVISHDNMLAVIEACKHMKLKKFEDSELMFLPMAHIFAKLLELTWLAIGHEMIFCQSIPKMADNMKETKPTFMAAVPRVYEKMHSGIITKIMSDKSLGGKVAQWGIHKLEETIDLHKKNISNKSLSWTIAKKFVLPKVGRAVAKGFGGRMQLFVSGGAPLAPEIIYFFHHIGFTICEGYGLTETAGAVCINSPENVCIGTVGQAPPEVEIKTAEDGEILIRGRCIFSGYWQSPELTADVISPDGWFHTGDIGYKDEQGYLRITDRKKDLIITAGGKNVAPQKIENMVKSKSQLISQIVIHGDKRKFLSALVTLEPDATIKWAKQQEIPETTIPELMHNEKIKAEVDKVIQEVNKSLASYETIKMYHILDHDFTVGNQLTPTLKVRRKIVNEKYKDIFSKFYPEE